MKRFVASMAVTALIFTFTGCGDDKPAEEQAAEKLDEALAAHAEGRIDEATEVYREVLDDDPTNQWAYYNLGLIDQQAGRAVQAEENYRKALQADPNFASALFNLAILRSEAAPDEAENLYRRVIEIQPDNASAHLNLGFLLLGQGDEQDGRRELRTAVALDPSLESRVPSEDPQDPQDEPQDPSATTTTVSP
jgi:tetratricopeptide (TPR) repeat protein